MRKISLLLFTFALAVVVVAVSSCARPVEQSAPMTFKMATSADSMSYVVGMNIARNLMDMDTMINADVVCRAIRDTYAGKLRMNDEVARAAYLKYMNYDSYERLQQAEARFLADLRKGDRKFVATSSGLTYKVQELGNLKVVARNNRDTLHMRYRLLDMAGGVLDTAYYHADTLRIAFGELTRGMQESIKLIGEGGHIESWLPSKLGYGADGCDSLGILPNTLLYCEMWLVEVEER